MFSDIGWLVTGCLVIGCFGTPTVYRTPIDNILNNIMPNDINPNDIYPAKLSQKTYARGRHKRKRHKREHHKRERHKPEFDINLTTN